MLCVMHCRDMTSDSATSSLASWFNAAGLGSLSPPPRLPAAAVTAGRTSIMSLDQCTRVMPTEQRADGGHGGVDRMLAAGLGRRPTVLYAEDRRDVISSAIRPSAIDQVATASNCS